ncbi:hypothetical protein [Luedemannella helvata]|uniref:Uncharacterized protein n=1 Tax=Luedemannella helvata TaxID=349315 RepID=A0ABP4WYY7_9ACTN
MGEQGDSILAAVATLDTWLLWAIWSGVVVLTGLILLTYGVVVVRRDRKRARLADRPSTAEPRIPRQLPSAPARLALPAAPTGPASPARPPAGRRERRPPGPRTPVKVPRQRGRSTVETPAPEPPVSAPPDLGGKALAAATTTTAEPSRPAKRGRGGRPSVTECVELRRRCEELRRQAAAANAAAARATVAAEQAADRRVEARRERAAAQERRDEAARATAAATSAAQAEARRLAERRGTVDDEGERVTTHAAFAAFRRGDITAEQLREVFRRAEGWTPQQDDLTHEVTRCRAVEADAQRTLDFALTTEQVADELAEEAARTAQQLADAARAVGEQAREVCAAADECEGGRKRRR